MKQKHDGAMLIDFRLPFVPLIRIFKNDSGAMPSEEQLDAILDRSNMLADQAEKQKAKAAASAEALQVTKQVEAAKAAHQVAEDAAAAATAGEEGKRGGVAAMAAAAAMAEVAKPEEEGMLSITGATALAAGAVVAADMLLEVQQGAGGSSAQVPVGDDAGPSGSAPTGPATTSAPGAAAAAGSSAACPSAAGPSAAGAGAGALQSSKHSALEFDASSAPMSSFMLVRALASTPPVIAFVPA